MITLAGFSLLAALRGDSASACGDRTEGVEVGALVPIDLRQPGGVSLGNRFGILRVLLPVGVEHPLERLMTVRQRTLALNEPATTLGLFAALGYLPKVVQDQLFNLLLSRATAVMTNLPGPTEPLTVAGSTLKQSLFWVPQTGDVGMGVSIFSIRRAGPVLPHHRRGADPRPGSGGQPLPGGVREVPLLRVARYAGGRSPRKPLHPRAGKGSGEARGGRGLTRACRD